MAETTLARRPMLPSTYSITVTMSVSSIVGPANLPQITRPIQVLITMQMSDRSQSPVGLEVLFQVNLRIVHRHVDGLELGLESNANFSGEWQAVPPSWIDRVDWL